MKLKTIFLLKKLKPLKGYAACIAQAAYPFILPGLEQWTFFRAFPSAPVLTHGGK
ncbi:MAG: hypothetical protein ACLUF9_08055 [Oscillospiraceae bacterium]